MVNHYQVFFSPEAESGLGHLDKQVAQRILDRIKWLSQHIEDVNHKTLTGKLKRTFKLRVGDYRVIYGFNRNTSSLTVLMIGHRSDIYK
jgi:mRNA interferase RelE/StbE